MHGRVIMYGCGFHAWVGLSCIDGGHIQMRIRTNIGYHMWMAVLYGMGLSCMDGVMHGSCMDWVVLTESSCMNG